MVEANEEASAKFTAIGIQAETIKNVLKNKKVTAALLEIISLSGVSECPKEQGSLLYALATKLKPNHSNFREPFAKHIVEGKWTKVD